MSAAVCFVYLCITYCQELVAKPGGQYGYTQPNPVYIDYKCLQQEIENDYFSQ